MRCETEREKEKRDNFVFLYYFFLPYWKPLLAKPFRIVFFFLFSLSYLPDPKPILRLKFFSTHFRDCSTILVGGAF